MKAKVRVAAKTKLRRTASKKKSVSHAIKRKVYCDSDLTLVLGDGDFSFSKGLVLHRGGSGRGLFATSLDSESKVTRKYPNAKECIDAIRARKGVVLHDVDATRLHDLPLETTISTGHDAKSTGKFAIPRYFQFIIFNFPHTGQQRVHINRALLSDFFESARSKLLRHGEVHVTLKNRPPYSNWNVEEQAKVNGFALKERRTFDSRSFPGYQHRTTDPLAKKFEAELCITYVFVVNRSKFPFVASLNSQLCPVVYSAPKSSMETPVKTQKQQRRWRWWRPVHLAIRCPVPGQPLAAYPF